MLSYSITMKRVNIILCLFFILFSISCSSAISTKKTYQIDVPLIYQETKVWCLPACTLMCAEFFADIVGWSDEDFLDGSNYEVQEYISDFFWMTYGSSFYPYSNDGAPQSISAFMRYHINITNDDFAELSSDFSCNSGSMFQIIPEIQIDRQPLISVLGYKNINPPHAVVVTGYQKDLNTNKTTKVYYNDPYYGERHVSYEQWEFESLVNDSGYLTLFFKDYN